uniref:CSON014589 protein n=1 Tax=Culicoides sonorensis TaxID=179676 RepID=A0A336MDS9_CULSO
MASSQVIRVFFALLVVFALVAPYINGQVTFSRDWNAGKRSIETLSECSPLYRLCSSLFKNFQPGHHSNSANDEIESGTIFGSRI